MKRLRRLLLIGVMLFSSSSIVQAQTQNESPTLTRIGRGIVQSVEWHPDGDYILVSTVTGAWLYTPDLQDHSHIPDAQLATLSPDGRYIVGVDDTHHIRLWDAQTLESIDSSDTTASFRRVWTLAWSPDSRFLIASGFRDEALTLGWDLNANTTFMTTRLIADELKWSPDSRRLAMVISATNTAYLFDIMTGGDRTNMANARTLEASSVVWRDENHLLTLIHDENTDATLWNVETDEQVDTWRLSAHARPHFNRNGSLMANGVPRGIGLYQLSDGESMFIEVGEEYFGAYIVAWSGDDNWLAAGTWSFSRATPAKVLIIDPNTGEIMHRLGGAQKSIQHLAWNNDNQSLLAVDEHQQMFVYDVVSGEAQAYSDAHTLVGETMSWRPDSTQFVIASSLNNITLWDTQREEQIHRFPDTAFPITWVKWQPDGDWVAVQAREPNRTTSLGASLVFQIWDTRTSENITDRFGFDDEHTIDFFDWHPDGTRLATLSGNTLTIWDVGSGAITTEATSDYSLRDVQDLMWSPSGNYIIAPMLGYGTHGSYIYSLDTDSFTLGFAYLLNGTAVWAEQDTLISMSWGWSVSESPNLVTPELSRLVEPYFSHVSDNLASESFMLHGLQTNTQLGFLSSTGSYAVAVDESGSGMLWDATTGAPLAMLTDVAQVAWSPDETLLVLQRLDGSLWLLNADGTIHTVLSVTASVQEPVGHLFWSPDSSRLAHLHNGVLDIWTLDE